MKRMARDLNLLFVVIDKLNDYEKVYKFIQNIFFCVVRVENYIFPRKKLENHIFVTD